MITEVIKLKYIYRFDSETWCYATGSIVVLLLFLLMLIYRIRRGVYPLGSNQIKNMSREELNRRYPYGVNFTYLFAIPVTAGVCVILACTAIHRLTRSTVATIAEDRADMTTYAWFSGDRPAGVGWAGEYILNETEYPLTLWKAGENKSDHTIRIIANVPAQGTVKVKELPSMYLGSGSKDVIVHPGTVIVSPMNFIDSIFLMPHSELSAKTTEEGLKLITIDMFRILNRNQYEQQRLIREIRRQLADSIIQSRKNKPESSVNKDNSPSSPTFD